MILTFSNATSCLRNTVALFHVIQKELEWREANGRPLGFEAMRKSKPIVAVGPDHPLEEEELMADFFRKHPADVLPASHKLTSL